jgi:hypothetical protein
MSRVYGDSVEVHTKEDGRPARFLWRGRLYAVREILEHWVVNREWWRDTDEAPRQPEMLYWRVEAAAGQGMPSGVYELRGDVSAGTWTLRRVAD